MTNKIKITYRKTLNKKIFTKDKMISAIREGALKVAEIFINGLDLPKITINSVDDIILTGSNAAFNYSDLSDFDLHLVLDYDQAIKDYGAAAPVLFNTYRSLWNQNHSITLGNQPVEMYIQPTDDDLVAVGIYSIKNDTWIKKPEYNKPVFDGSDVDSKVEAVEQDIDMLLASGQPNKNRVKEVLDSIREMRKIGLSTAAAEWSTDNLVYKQLRNNGSLQKLFDAYGSAGDKELTVEEFLDQAK